MGFLANLTRKRVRRSSTPASQYRSVEISTQDTECCRAARALSGQRFLSDNIPKLPLDGCDAAKCQCSYELYDDRRSGKRSSR